MCFPESGLKKNVVHKGRYDKNTKGICGIKTYLIGEVPYLTKENINTLKGGELTLDYFLSKNNNNLFEALKDYKGSIKNLEPVYKTLRIYEDIK